ncbi:MAG: hypothetical protein ACD_79C01014G0001 [uncultured bacterium]|nr:MAG: hypothetical protein ACD_79C01014G0001 [uncultured bacterium]
MLFVLLLLSSLLPCIDNAMALAAGIIFSLVFINPFSQFTGKWNKILLQVSVVGLGFGIGIGQVIKESEQSVIYTIIGITLTLVIGKLIGKLLKVNANTSQLISFGTAICGGSAIAAIAPVIRAKDEEIAVSLAIIFTLNSIALFVFPFIGHLLHLSQDSFGLWAALAIHDTSSVVGASAAFGVTALAVGTTVKLTRALWITPIVMGYAFFRKTDREVKFPFFILGFLIAAIIRSFLPNLIVVWDGIALGGRRLLVVTLFLIGSNLTGEVLKKVGYRPFLQGIILWLLVSIITLSIITH